MIWGDLLVEVRETTTRRYVALVWRNGLLPMVADVRDGADLRRAKRMASEMGLYLTVTEEARRMLEGEAA